MLGRFFLMISRGLSKCAEQIQLRSLCEHIQRNHQPHQVIFAPYLSILLILCIFQVF